MLEAYVNNRLPFQVLMKVSKFLESRTEVMEFLGLMEDTNTNTEQVNNKVN